MATPEEMPDAEVVPEVVAPALSLDDQLENADDFLTLYPGIYSPHERELVEAYFAENAAIEARGPDRRRSTHIWHIARQHAWNWPDGQSYT